MELLGAIAVVSAVVLAVILLYTVIEAIMYNLRNRHPHDPKKEAADAAEAAAQQHAALHQPPIPPPAPDKSTPPPLSPSLQTPHAPPVPIPQSTEHPQSTVEQQTQEEPAVPQSSTPHTTAHNSLPEHSSHPIIPIPSAPSPSALPPSALPPSAPPSSHEFVNPAPNIGLGGSQHGGSSGYQGGTKSLPTEKKMIPQGKDGSIFHGSPALRKRKALQVITKEAKKIVARGPQYAEKYGIKGIRKWELKKFAKKALGALPHSVSPGVIEKRELTKGLRNTKRQYAKNIRLGNTEGAVEAKKMVRFLKKISGKER